MYEVSANRWMSDLLGYQKVYKNIGEMAAAIGMPLITTNAAGFEQTITAENFSYEAQADMNGEVQYTLAENQVIPNVQAVAQGTRELDPGGQAKPKRQIEYNEQGVPTGAKGEGAKYFASQGAPCSLYSSCSAGYKRVRSWWTS